MAVGEMVALSASDGDIDTSEELNMFSGYQKVFVVNGSNLKVVDFINTKLTSTAEISNMPSHGDILKQNQTGGDYAYMVVDFVSDWDGSNHYIYGYAYYGGTATAFTTSHNIININDGDAIVIAAADLSSVNEASDTPHWYDWTVYNGNSSNYGSMPDKAYIGCLYRGRAVLSGNPYNPEQWYMSRQANLWDWAYTANDAQSPVSGGNADAGKTGDVIRALIPYKDDYLVFGCASSMWYLAGDPATGGSLNELDLTVGIFGPNSWCFDGEGNMYFWGTNGIYVTPVPGNPKCISNIQLPNLVNDEAADPTTHRITLGYDRVRSGILIAITELSDGSNSNWWLDLRSGGLFPESYPNANGIYSMFYYGANDPDYRDLLVGTRDGYICKFDESKKNDDEGATETEIDSYVTFGPIPLSKNGIKNGKLSGLKVISGGGSLGGSNSDSDDIDCKIYVGNSAEKIIEKFNAVTNPRVNGTFKAPGRRAGSKWNQKVKGIYSGIRLGNSNSDETWSLEKLSFNISESGKAK